LLEAGLLFQRRYGRGLEQPIERYKGVLVVSFGETETLGFLLQTPE
jgi:hypothetical protein